MRKTFLLLTLAWLTGSRLASPYTACSGSTCPQLIQARNFGSNDSNVNSSTFHLSLPNPTLAGNLLVVAYSYASATATISFTDNLGTNAWANAVSGNDGTKTLGIAYVSNVAAGTLEITASVSASVADFTASLFEFNNVSQSSPLDGTGQVNTNVEGPTVSLGSKTLSLSESDDLVLAWAVDTGSFCCTNETVTFAPQEGFSLLPSDQRASTTSMFLAWGESGTMDPTIDITQTGGTDSFDMAAVAFKSAPAGNSPGSAPRVACIGSTVDDVYTWEMQVPCPVSYASVDEYAVLFNDDVADMDITSITDSEGGTITKINLPSGAFPEAFYSNGQSIADSNTKYFTINFTGDTYGIAAVWYAMTGIDPTAGYDGVVFNNGPQTVNPGSNCQNTNPGGYSTITGTPDTSGRAGIALVNEFNGIGPECSVVSAGGIFDAWWYPGEPDDDSLAYQASGFAHVYYASQTAQTITFNYANNTITSWQNNMIFFKGPSSTSTSGPALELSPSLLSFGNQAVGTASSAQTLTLSNSGTSSATISTIAFSGTNASDFSQTNNCGTLPATLAASGSCTIQVTFIPGAKGSRSATLMVTDTPDSLTASVTLSGTGSAVSPALSLTPSSVAFGNQNINTSSSAHSLTLKNTGTASATISSIAFSGTNASDFSQTNNCGTLPATLAASGSCTIQVTFTPGASGSRSATLTVTDAPDSLTASVTLSGTGSAVSPALSLTPSSVAFGNQNINTSSSAHSLTLRNTGTASATVSSIAFSGTNASDFSQTNNCGTLPATLGAKDSCTIKVKFTPGATGSRSATITVTDTPDSLTASTALSGTGTSPHH